MAKFRNLCWSNCSSKDKAKGKELDEVIIYEGYYNSKIANIYNIEQARLNLRVSVTRAMSRATIITPKNDVCQFL